MPVQRTVLSALLLLAFSLLVSGQTPKPAQPAAKKTKPAPEYVLRVSTKDLLSISLKAEKASLPKIATELSRKLKVPVVVGRSALAHEVTADFKQLTLEPALHLLAPQVYVDYEINHAPGAQSRPIGIYFNGYEDPEPPVSSVVPARAEAILIEGHTEDVPEPTGDEPTKVVYEQNSLTVSAKRQPLSVVLYRVASELHIPFELKWEASQLVDVQIDKLPLEEAMPRLSPHVRLFIRANLQKFERRPFRMILVRPPDSGPPVSS
ncbi:MAG TPA: hypothetical protein VIT88_13210 [Pyrinomonadaceae bacterium]